MHRPWQLDDSSLQCDTTAKEPLPWRVMFDNPENMQIWAMVHAHRACGRIALGRSWFLRCKVPPFLST